MKYLVDKNNWKLLFRTVLILLVGYIIEYYISPLGFFVMFILEVTIIMDYIKKREAKVESLTYYLETLNRGDYRYDISAYQEGELARLQAELNRTTVTVRQMNEELGEKQEILKRAIEDMSHQLKTPVSSLLILNELQDQNDELVWKSKDQIERIQYLVESLIKLMKLESKTESFDIKRINLDECIMQAVSLSEFGQINNHVEVHYDLKGSECLADFNQTKEAIINVLSNKVRYAKSNVYIQSYQYGLSTILKIYDDGDRIELTERQNVFTRFYSGKKRDSKSVGIGLPIAKEIMLNQKGNLNIEEDNTFVFTFERFKSDDSVRNKS